MAVGNSKGSLDIIVKNIQKVRTLMKYYAFNEDDTNYEVRL